MTTRLEFKADLTVTPEGLIEGIAWPFGSADRVGDIIEKGAITTPKTLPMLFAHDQAQVIGVWDQIAETDAGLTVKGRLLIDDVARANEVRAMITAEAVTGLSIGFITNKSKPRAKGRTISALTLHEISVVAVPCHPGAQITSLKSDDTTPMNKENHMEPELIDDQAPATPANAPHIDTKAFDEIKARLDKMEAKANRPQGVHITQRDDKIESKAFGSYLRRGAERIPEEEIKALTVGSDVNGGYLAPTEFGSELIKLLDDFSPLRQYAKVIQISAPSITYPRRVTGTTATWAAETGNRTPSGMTFEQITMTPHELATYTDVSVPLLEDNAYNLEGELLGDFAESFAKAEGLAFIKGTGVGQPVGIMTASDIAEIKTGVAANFPATNPADVLIGMYHKIASVFAQSGVWMMNRNTLAVIRTWKDNNGRYLVIDPISEGAPSTLLGRPIVEMIDMDDIGAGKSPILFGDMSGYRIVERVGLTTLRDPFSLATNGQIRFHARKRVGADLTHPDRFIKLKCAA